MERIRPQPATRRPLRFGDAVVALLLAPFALLPLAAHGPAEAPAVEVALLRATALPAQTDTIPSATDLRARRLAIERRLQTLSDVERMGGVQAELIAELRAIAAQEATRSAP